MRKGRSAWLTASSRSQLAVLAHLFSPTSNRRGIIIIIIIYYYCYYYCYDYHLFKRDAQASFPDWRGLPQIPELGNPTEQGRLQCGIRCSEGWVQLSIFPSIKWECLSAEWFALRKHLVYIYYIFGSMFLLWCREAINMGAQISPS